jgi:hypothetical protein
MPIGKKKTALTDANRKKKKKTALIDANQKNSTQKIWISKRRY